jgi:hypothetical protein
MNKWIELTDEYANKIKALNTKRKIRLQNGEEIWAFWHAREKCFFWNDGDGAAYMDEPDNRPTHILVKRKLVSPCCNARISASLADGVLTGSCDKCHKDVIRRNPETGQQEWLDGQSPWTKAKLRKVNG